MKITQQQLMRLPVVTELGIKLGTIHDMEIDVETHQIRKYVVGRFLGREIYHVAPTQIKKITDQEVIVEDAVIKIGSPKLEKSLQSPTLEPLSPSMPEASTSQITQ